MALITLLDAQLAFGHVALLDHASLSLETNERVGLIGRNGAGKSSLLKILGGLAHPDDGNLQLQSGVRIAYVAQEPDLQPEHTVFQAASTGLAEVAALRDQYLSGAEGVDLDALQSRIEAQDAWNWEQRVEETLQRLHLKADAVISNLSGGVRKRVALAQALVMQPDVLLLDEPTNHLDLDAVLWLEQWLLKYPGTLLVISHDREFLDGISTHTLHLNEGRAKLYAGDYTSFERQRAEHLRQQQIAHEKEQVERAHLQKFIDRFKAKASKAKQAQSRMKRLEKLAGTEAVRAERSLHIDFAEPLKLPTSLIRLNHVDAGYAIDGGGSARILRDVGFGLESGDRVGLLGPNGAGKSTLVKTLVGDLALLAGERNAHPDLRIGYFAQHTVESLRPGASPVDHLRDLAPNTATQEFRDFLGRWNFAGDRAFESVDGFSGGERARLALALIAWRRPNVLLLDEPTNHLDLDMREALAEALSDYAGAIVLVSHDRHLIGLVCDTFWRVAGGRVEEFDGDLDAYAAWLRSRPATGEATADASPKTAAAKPAAEKSAPPPRKNTDPGLARRLKRIETRLEEIRLARETIERDLADPDLYATAGAERLAELGFQQAQLAREQESLESEWLELA